jgi:hypothetical protein
LALVLAFSRSLTLRMAGDLTAISVMAARFSKPPRRI